MQESSTQSALEHDDSAPHATSMLTVVDLFVGVLLVAGWFASVVGGCALPKQPLASAGGAQVVLLAPEPGDRIP